MEGRSIAAAAGIFSPGMRAYFIPLVAGVVLAVSAFLPWVIVGDATINGVPDVEALWVAGLGALAAVLALLSLITRRNSRHPLLIVGLFALGITFLSWRIMPRTAGERATTLAQAFAIVDETPVEGGARRHRRHWNLSGACGVVRAGCVRSDDCRQARLQPYIVASPDDDV